MPFARISLLQGKSPAWLRAVSDAVQQALEQSFEVPAGDRFQVIEQLAPGSLVFDRDYLGGPRSDDFVLIALTAGRPRSTETKQAFFGSLVHLLEASPGIRPADVMVVITTTEPDSWSFGFGRATMIVPPDAAHGGTPQ
ncbi:tautomerase family protein [Jeongeupia chitinilytica]|uniref:4-oxalocrotonate tautomerase n=1 Tax=Jeongeupia chitinilytica TaxID=1041641 RepID=A0ABQ3H4Y8_9NEIS|nr:tautomerase family protein [Jeongeupia chitinilytica]GHD68381.1 putative 4-oxalocrotonate tautomerase [Jeongeupia chitinilytica]